MPLQDANPTPSFGGFGLSLKKLCYDLIDFETTTYEGKDRDQPTLQRHGNPDTLTPPTYKPHAMGTAGPFLNQRAIGIQRPLNLLRSRLLDRRYNFLLRPGPWEPDVDGKIQRDLDALLGVCPRNNVLSDMRH